MLDYAVLQTILPDVSPASYSVLPHRESLDTRALHRGSDASQSATPPSSGDPLLASPQTPCTANRAPNLLPRSECAPVVSKRSESRSPQLALAASCLEPWRCGASKRRAYRALRCAIQ